MRGGVGRGFQVAALQRAGTGLGRGLSGSGVCSTGRFRRRVSNCQSGRCSALICLGRQFNVDETTAAALWECRCRGCREMEGFHQLAGFNFGLESIDEHTQHTLNLAWLSRQDRPRKAPQEGSSRRSRNAQGGGGRQANQQNGIELKIGGGGPGGGFDPPCRKGCTGGGRGVRVRAIT